MKALKNYLILLFIATTTLCVTSCDDDDDTPQGPQRTGRTKVYTLNALAVPDISGTATFIEFNDNSTTVELSLQNTPTDGVHPAHIHFNTAVEGGGIAISLADVDGNTGTSSINFKQQDDGTPITYEQLLDFDGYINVHLSATELATIVAQGDIGQNELTGTKKTYDLATKDVQGINGTAEFAERVNGNSLVTIELAGTPAGGSHPAHIHVNTAVEGGGIAISLNDVDGDTGKSLTSIEKKDDDTAITYNQLLDFDGYINVHLSATELSTIVAQGDIGQNELTGTTKTYDLASKDVQGISGIAEFAERVNGTTLVTIELTGTPAGGIHPAHIHENDVAMGGPIIVGLTSVDGNTGISKTQVEELVGGAAVSYNDLLTINAHINVHLSDADLATIVAQGDIGANEGSAGTATNYNVTNSGASAYVFNDSGFTNASNPNLTLKRGMTYTFTVNAPGHPFLIKSVQGTGTANQYNDGVTNNGAVNGTVTFTVPSNAPNTLFYNCEFHASMTGTITITD